MSRIRNDYNSLCSNMQTFAIQLFSGTYSLNLRYNLTVKRKNWEEIPCRRRKAVSSFIKSESNSKIGWVYESPRQKVKDAQDDLDDALNQQYIDD